MNKKFEIIIGLEVHVRLKTCSKLFCACNNIDEGIAPNKNVCPTCFGSVGTLPLLNKEAFLLGIRASKALKCSIAKKCKWDRKQYFYPDLPKGYQISQYDMPFAKNGELEFFLDEKNLKKILINRVHLEEDAAKLLHTKKDSLVDFNRSGVPLIEIVTEPDLRSASEAKQALKEIHRIVRNFEISDADMEKGQLRCDASVSLRPYGNIKLYPRTEIKNLNSFRMVEMALQYEIDKQTKEWLEDNFQKTQRTVLWNSVAKKTEFMRGKETEADYRYFPEPDVPEVEIESQLITESCGDSFVLPIEKVKKYLAIGLYFSIANILVSNKKLAEYFDCLMRLAGHNKELRTELQKLFCADFLAVVKKRGLQNIQLTPSDFFKIVHAVFTKKVSKQLARKIFNKALLEKIEIEKEINIGTEESFDLENIINGIFVQHKEIVEQYKAGNTKVINVLIGISMKKTKGIVSAQDIAKIIKEKLRT